MQAQLAKTAYAVRTQSCVLLFESDFFVGVAHVQKGQCP